MQGQATGISVPEPGHPSHCPTRHPTSPRTSPGPPRRRTRRRGHGAYTRDDLWYPADVARAVQVGPGIHVDLPPGFTYSTVLSDLVGGGSKEFIVIAKGLFPKQATSFVDWDTGADPPRVTQWEVPPEDQAIFEAHRQAGQGAVAG